jgi:hypothetical protein
MMVSNSAPKHQLVHCRSLGLASCTGMIVPPRSSAEHSAKLPGPPARTLKLEKPGWRPRSTSAVD